MQFSKCIPTLISTCFTLIKSVFGNFCPRFASSSACWRRIERNCSKFAAEKVHLIHFLQRTFFTSRYKKPTTKPQIISLWPLGYTSHYYQFILYAHCVQNKKHATLLLPLTLPNANRFSDFFHQQT